MKKMAFVTFELNKGERIEDVAKRLKKHLGGRNVGYAIIEGMREIVLPPKTEEPWKTKLKEILKDLGVSSHLNGYDMLICIMEYIALYRPEKVKLKDIYAYIFDTKKIEYKAIDKDVRYVIKKICEYNSYEQISYRLGVSIGNLKLTPTAFITLLKEAVFG